MLKKVKCKIKSMFDITEVQTILIQDLNFCCTLINTYHMAGASRQNVKNVKIVEFLDYIWVQISTTLPSIGL